MNFKDLENVEIGTILVSNHGVERYFDGFTRVGDSIKTERCDSGYCCNWDEAQIKDWEIKKKEPRKLGRLYMAMTDVKDYKKGDIWIGDLGHRIGIWQPVTIKEDGNVVEILND